MKAPHLLLVASLLTLACATLCAQLAPLERVVRAAAANDEGRFHAAIALVEPLLRPGAHPSGETVIGMAWNICGLAYQTLGDYDRARRSYEAAIKNLQTGPERRGQYASALDNLGSLDFEIGQWRASKSLRLRAKRMYALANDHAGIARMSTQLALLALERANRREARRYLAETFREQSLVPAPDSGDLAETYIAQCLFDGRQGDFPSALISINRAIDLWRRHYGLQYYMLAPAYVLRGQVFSRLGDHKNAANDLETSLALLKASNDVNPATYFLAEAIYANVLRQAGLRSEARQIESEASASLEGLRHQPCAGCSIGAQSLR